MIFQEASRLDSDGFGSTSALVDPTLFSYIQPQVNSRLFVKLKAPGGEKFLKDLIDYYFS